MDVSSHLPELLCPAGNIDRLKTALTYGADAVYLGGTELNLRSKARGFSEEDLIQAKEHAKTHRSKVYFCLNALPLEKDTPAVEEHLHMVSRLKPDALIIADPGVISLAKKITPDIELHLSTQANTCNSYSVNFWKDQGIKRVNLSRELGIKDIKAISSRTDDIELEMFVHGAMCMAISGRCFLSAHLNQRSANKGLCAHPCRYEYKEFNVDLEEKTRPGYPVWTLKQEDEYSKIFSAEDLCLVKYIPWLIKNNIHSLKIEGRTKSESYLALVTDVYRTALNDLTSSRFRPDKYLQELALINIRPMGSGFFLKNKIFFTDKQTGPARNKKILAKIVKRLGSDEWLVQVKEKWQDSLNVELILPGLERPIVKSEDYSLENESGQKTDTAHSGMNAVVRTENQNLQENTFIRMN
ncbi:MAG: peptidase U32 family protein [Desulfonatronovibrio sp.]